MTTLTSPQAHFLQDGHSIDHTPGSAVNAGEVVVLGSTLVAIAKVDISANRLGALATTGLFDVVKDASDITGVSAAYWDDDGDPVDGEAGTGAFSGDSSKGPFAGWFLAAAGTTVGRARLFLRSFISTDQEALDLADLANVGVDTATSGHVLVADGDSWESVAVSGDAALAANGATTLNAALAQQVVLIPIENLSADGDISARPVFADPRGATLVSAALIAQGAFGDVDGSNTIVVALKDGGDTNTIVTKTYDNVTVPTDGGVNDLGALDATHKVLTANEIVHLTVTCGTTADPPAMLLRLVFRPTNA